MLMQRSFFKNMSLLSPVLTDHYANHANHQALLHQEPLLCCIILTVSSRYHLLPGTRALSRGYFIHDRFWKHCQHLIMRLILGQEQGSVAKIRSLGSIEALLLLSEWHPRALHFPPESEGWDYDVLDGSGTDERKRSSATPPDRWLEDVIEPARRSDRMSCMLLGCGLSLAQELGVFNEKHTSGADSSFRERCARVGKLLYVFMNQLASRLGTRSFLPQNTLQGLRNVSSGGTPQWDRHMAANLELTNLLKSISEMVFPSKGFTEQLLQSGRYESLLEHYLPLLDQWEKDHLNVKGAPFTKMGKRI